MNLPLRYGPRLHDFAYRRLEDDCRINILTGSVRSGKTWATIPKIIYACQYPVGGWRFITGQSKQSIFTNVLADLFNLIGPSNYHYNHQSGFLRLGRSNWMVKGASDEGSDKFIRGATVGVAICDELVLMPKTFFQMLLTRMSPEGARLYGTTNCDSPKHWLKEEYLDDEKLRRMKLLWSGHYTMDDNPNLTKEYVDSQKALYKGLFYERFILGHWVMAEGAIYRDAWDDSILFDDDSTPMGLYGQGGHVDRWIAIDCGVDHPQVYLEFYDDGDTIWIPREWCWDSRKMMQQLTDGQYADRLMEFMGPANACQIIVPPEAASFKAELGMRGLWVTDANNEVIEGIQTVSSILARRKVRIHKHCAGLIREIETYAWDEKAARRGVEQPIKVDDNYCDSFRYGLHEKIPRWRYA